ncbi:hypothetical protein [Streptomyces avicenniae]|uniref:hypothetical protein n=1 Tax=Streptomyces avicenniae TaxID=500153 RepID=UPI00069C6898|nr:hypothetical protein [Streptomyces avicenniae]
MTAAQPTDYDRRMSRLMNRDEGRRWHARRGQRRAWTAAHVALTAGLLATFALADGGALLLALVVPLLLAWCVCAGALNSATRGLLELRSRALDERQLAERAHVHTSAHRTQLAVLLAVALVLLLGDGLPDGVTTAGVVVALAAVHWLLPLWTAALRAGDEPDDDPVEAAAS